jgi:hypothetical protein
VHICCILKSGFCSQYGHMPVSGNLGHHDSLNVGLDSSLGHASSSGSLSTGILGTGPAKLVLEQVVEACLLEEE